MMAEYVLQEQCRLFVDFLRKQYAADSDDTRRNSKNRAVFDRLADTFTSHDILALKTDITDSTARNIIGDGMRLDGRFLCQDRREKRAGNTRKRKRNRRSVAVSHRRIYRYRN